MSKTKLGLAIASLVVAGQISAAYTFPTFSTAPNNTAAAGLQETYTALTGAPAGSYNSYTVSLNWVAGTGGPWSSEAIFALTDLADISNPATVFLADPGPSPASLNTGASVTLTWTGLMDFPYTSGDPLFFVAAQTFSGSRATWSNISVTIDSVVIVPPNVTPFSGDTTGDPTWNRPLSPAFSSLDPVATDTPYEVIPFFVSADGLYDISHDQNDGLPGQWDGFVFLYEDSFDPSLPLVNGIAGDDDGDGGIGTSDFGTLLTAGTQYYLVTTGYDDIDFGTYTGTISSTAGVASIGLIPEPSSLSILAGAGLLAARRRRAA